MIHSQPVPKNLTDGETHLPQSHVSCLTVKSLFRRSLKSWKILSSLSSLKSLWLNPREKQKCGYANPLPPTHPCLINHGAGLYRHLGQLRQNDCAGKFWLQKGVIRNTQDTQSLALLIQTSGAARPRQPYNKGNTYCLMEYKVFSTAKETPPHRDSESPSSADRRKQELALQHHLLENKRKISLSTC